ncbi:MAG: hypothetical protein V3R30_08855, partial [Kiloniellales bacterium]
SSPVRVGSRSAMTALPLTRRAEHRLPVLPATSGLRINVSEAMDDGIGERVAAARRPWSEPHRLLEFCRIVDALIVDHDGIYGSEASERQAGSRAEGDDERSRAVDVPATLARGASRDRYGQAETPRQRRRHQPDPDKWSTDR